MKKLLFGLACAAALAGAANNIESANVVGYTARDCKATKFYMTGVQFNAVGSTSATIALKDFITGDFAAVEFDDEAEWTRTSPHIFVNDPATGAYANYYYQTDAQGTGESADGWVDVGADYADETPLTLGQSVWFMNPSADCSISVAGEVMDSASASVSTVAGKFKMVANPFPAKVELNTKDLTLKNIAAVEFDDDATWLTTSPRICINDPATGAYVNYYYQTDAQGTGESDDGWVDVGADYADGVTIAPGEGFWFWAANAGELVFTK